MGVSVCVCAWVVYLSCQYGFLVISKYASIYIYLNRPRIPLPRTHIILTLSSEFEKMVMDLKALHASK